MYDENNPKHKECPDVVECGSGTFAYFLKDENELKEVAEYYDMQKTETVIANNKRKKKSLDCEDCTSPHC